MSDAKDRLSLKGILDAAEKIVDFSRPFSNADDFFTDRKSFDAVCMNLIILGEMVDLFFNFRHKFIPCRQI